MLSLMKSRKLSHSGFKIIELYSELESALLARDPERACSLTAELSCTVGHSRCVVCVLIDTYCARCVNSGRAQLNLLGSSLAYLGEGTSKSPNSGSCRESIFRRGLCTLTLLVACSSDPSRNVTERFARVPRSDNVPSLECALDLLRRSIADRDAHSMSSVLRAAQDEPWFRLNVLASKLDFPDVRRLRVASRREAVWDIWALARHSSEETGVAEYVENCLKAFSWGYCAQSRKSRMHLLWYSFLVIIKGAPRAGKHSIDPTTFQGALQTTDSLFDGILGDNAVTKPVADSTPDPADVVADAQSLVIDPPGADTSYLYTFPQLDQVKACEVEKDRKSASDALLASQLTLTKCVDIGPRCSRATHSAQSGPSRPEKDRSQGFHRVIAP